VQDAGSELLASRRKQAVNQVGQLHSIRREAQALHAELTLGERAL
jgi:hypothetical protein